MLLSNIEWVRRFDNEKKQAEAWEIEGWLDNASISMVFVTQKIAAQMHFLLPKWPYSDASDATSLHQMAAGGRRIFSLCSNCVILRSSPPPPPPPLLNLPETAPNYNDWETNGTKRPPYFLNMWLVLPIITGWASSSSWFGLTYTLAVPNSVWFCLGWTAWTSWASG